jgi:hypothetical protein
MDTPMYTFYMSWPFRTLVLGVLLAWGLAPQLACLMPDQALTPAEMDCCKEMAADCSAANMSHACCTTVIRTDLGIAAKVVRPDVPQLAVADRTPNIAAAFSTSFDRQISPQTGHAPPDKAGESSLILRI